jgi:hypothetical protein
MLNLSQLTRKYTVGWSRTQGDRAARHQQTHIDNVFLFNNLSLLKCQDGSIPLSSEPTLADRPFCSLALRFCLELHDLHMLNCDATKYSPGRPFLLLPPRASGGLPPILLLLEAPWQSESQQFSPFLRPRSECACLAERHGKEWSTVLDTKP